MKITRVNRLMHTRTVVFSVRAMLLMLQFLIATKSFVFCSNCALQLVLGARVEHWCERWWASELLILGNAISTPHLCWHLSDKRSIRLACQFAGGPFALVFSTFVFCLFHGNSFKCNKPAQFFGELLQLAFV